MTLLLTLMAAVVATLTWYASEKARQLKVCVLCYLFWGASLMWLVDAVFEYIEQRSSYFSPSASEMLNDAFLGMSVIVLAMTIWLLVLLVKDPKRVLWHR
ncbi:MAG: hypothetical protein IJ828_05330 [Treponema sp.]|nr:hypothetical protein [Treponema sp.]